MWLATRVGSLATWLKARVGYSVLVRSRKTTFIFLTAIVLFLIWTASKLFSSHRQIKGLPVHNHAKFTALRMDEVCLGNYLAKWSHKVDVGEAIVIHTPLHGHESPYLPFVGNGNVSVSAKKDSLLHIKQPMSYMEVSYSPLLVPVMTEAPLPKEATVIDLKHGIVHTIQSYLWSKSCVLVDSVLYAHRSHPSLLMQEISITNHGYISAKIHFKHDGAKEWRKALTKEMRGDGETTQYTVHLGMVGYVDHDNPGVNVTVVTTQVPPEMTVNGRTSSNVHHVTVIHSSVHQTSADMEVLEDQCKKDFVELMKKVDPKVPGNLLKSHMEVWKEIWQTGIQVDHRHDPDTPPGIEVNATMYYILSSFPSLDYDIDGKPQNTEQIEKLLHSPEHCFSGPPSMHSASLWPIPRTEASVNSMVSNWQRVLQQNGCASLIRAGATGIVQAMTLSFGGLQFSSGLFEFAANPASLHTSVVFRHIHLHRGVYVNVSVMVNEHTGHAEKLVVKAMGHSERPLYACEAGCQYEPVELSSSSVVFPVRMTKPVTPILYISHNKSQLISIKEHVFIKDAHQESLKHHHVYHHVGLPAKFWVTIAFLIVAFHLYLVKLIYTECFKEPMKSKIYLS